MCVADESFEMLLSLATGVLFSIGTQISVFIRWVLPLWNALHNEAEPRRLREIGYSLLRYITRSWGTAMPSAIATAKRESLYV